MKEIILVLVLMCCLVSSQRDTRITIVNHTEYILRVIQETVNEVERREWCNLKLPDIIVPVNETVIDSHHYGTVTYTNGFVVSIQNIDVQQSTVQQIWTWTNANRTGTVSLQGTLRMTDLALGYDVLAEMEDGTHRYTAVFQQPLISFSFRIIYSIHEEYISNITIIGEDPRTTTNLPNMFPKDKMSDILTVLFNPVDTVEGIKAWGADVFQPITTDVVTRLEFPMICYDCSL